MTEEIKLITLLKGGHVIQCANPECENGSSKEGYGFDTYMDFDGTKYCADCGEKRLKKEGVE